MSSSISDSSLPTKDRNRSNRSPKNSTSLSIPLGAGASGTGGAITSGETIDRLNSQIAEQSDIIQSLFDAFRIITEENVKKDKRIGMLEKNFEDMKSFMFMNIIDSMEGLKGKVGKFDRVATLEDELKVVRGGLDDVRYIVAMGGGSGGSALVGGTGGGVAVWPGQDF